MGMAKKMGGLAKAARRKLRKRAGLVETRRKKEFTYRGYTLDEMKAMTLEEIIELLPARPRRSVIRGIDDERYRFIEKLRANGTETAVRTHCRDVPILPDFIGKKVAIHNGKEFVTVEIKPEMIGHFIGEFAMTRKPVTHSGPGVGATRSSKFMPLK
jgi:small subunit ribosomal protein S19